jgi:hypothetical protein
MRYYDILISGAPPSFPSTPNGMTWSSHPLGDNTADPGAQEIIMSIEMQDSTYPTEKSVLEIKGVSWEQIKDNGQLIGKFIKVYAGMKPGLPIATSQSVHVGQLFQGRIVNSYGNWEGTEMSIALQFGTGMLEQSPSSNGQPSSGQSSDGQSSDGNPTPQIQYMREIEKYRYKRTGFRSIDRMPYPRGRTSRQPVVGVTDIANGGNGGGVGGGFDLSGFGVFQGLAGGFFGGGTPGLSKPLNLIHNMMPNMKLADAIHATLSRVFPQAKLNINISPLLKLNYQDAGMYQTMDQYASYIQKLSNSILGVKNYSGVHMSSHGNQIDVWDTSITSIEQGIISVIDLIGQPTWIEQQWIHVKTVLRPDLHINDIVELPQGIGMVGVGPNVNFLGQSPQRTNLSYSGKFRIFKIVHEGDFRSPHGQDWCTNYEMEPLNTETDQSKAADNAQKVDQQQNPNNAPVTNNPPAAPGDITPGDLPGVQSRWPLGVIPPQPNIRSPNAPLGSIFKRSVRRY